LSKIVHVAVGVILDEGGRILLTRRHQDQHQGGLWEFPGGKVESSESVQQALVRELIEEVGIEATAYHPFIQIEHDYGDVHVLLDVWQVTAFNKTPMPKEGQMMEWVHRSQLQHFEFPKANQAIVTALEVGDSIFITPTTKGIEKKEYLEKIQKALVNHRITAIQFRAHDLDIDTYIDWAKSIFDITQQTGHQLFYNTSIEVFKKLPKAGLHLTAKRAKSLGAEIKEDAFLSVSCHNSHEVESAIKLGASLIYLSPVLPTQSHPDATPIGWDEVKRISRVTTIPIYALGGLGQKDIVEAFENGASGIAGISTFIA